MVGMIMMTLQQTWFRWWHQVVAPKVVQVWWWHWVVAPKEQ